VSWLIISEKKIPDVDSSYTIEDRLRYFNIGIDTDLVIATKMSTTKENVSGNNGLSRTRIWGDRDGANNGDNERTYRRQKKDVRGREEGNYRERTQKQREEKRRRSNRNYKNINIRNDRYSEIENCRDNPNRIEYSGLEFSLLQVYKIRPNSNSSLIMIPLGSWNAVSGTSNLVPSNGIEQRNDFHGLPLFVGVKNASQNTAEVVGSAVKTTSLSTQSSDDEIEDDSHLMEVLDVITRSLNARFVTYVILS
jgi:hypothetical protein